MTATTSNLYDKVKRASASYARMQVQERKAPFEALTVISKAHLEGTIEGFDLALSMLARLRGEMQEGLRTDNGEQIAFPFAEGGDLDGRN